MLTKTDKKFLTENFATKKELSAMRDGFDLLREKAASLSLERFGLKNEIDALRASSIRTEEMVRQILTMQDGYAGKIADLDQENKMGARTIHRHGIQIHELAKATKTKISE